MTPLRILIVDDEPHIRAVTSAALAADGWIVDEAVDGVDALERLEVRRPDVMLLDLRMPRLDGPGLLRRLQAMTDPPILVAMSGYARDDDVVEVMRLGAVDFLHKPFVPSTLRAVLRAALAKEPPHAPVTVEEHLAAMKRHARVRRFDAAEHDARAAIAADSTNPDTHYFLGVLLELRGARAEARRSYERAVFLRPSLIAARRRLAKIDASHAASPTAPRAP